jgi:hypothetical protein
LLFEGVFKEGELNLLTTCLIPSNIPSNWVPKPGFRFTPQKISDDLLVKEAHNRHKAITHFSLNPPEAVAESKILIDHLSEGLQLFQKTVKYAYQNSLQRLGFGETIGVDSSDNYLFEVIGVETGSFTLHLQTVASADLMGYSNIERAFNILDEINEVEDNPQKVLELVTKYKGHFASAYKNLLRFVIDNDIPISYKWAMPKQDTSITRNLYPFKAKPIYEIIKERTELESEYKTFIGHFTKVDINTNAWRLLSTSNNKEYSGISETNLSGIVMDIQLYEIECEEKMEIEVGTGREHTKLHLRSLKLLP